MSASTGAVWQTDNNTLLWVMDGQDITEAVLAALGAQDASVTQSGIELNDFIPGAWLPRVPRMVQRTKIGTILKVWSQPKSDPGR